MAKELDGIQEVNRKLKEKLNEIGHPMTERFVTEMMISIQGHAASMTPIDTSALINSQYRRLTQSGDGYEGEVGYGAEYAAAVHEMPGTLKGQPREDFGMTSNYSSVGPQIPRAFGGGSGQGTYWSPDAEPKFLEKGIEEMLQNDLAGIIERSFKL